jgi:hypothetical protein
MTLKLTAERYAKRREEMMQRLTQGVREMFAESAAKQSMAGRMYPNLIKPTSHYIGILRIGNYGEHGETIFLARRTSVPRARDSGGLSAHLADNPVRHCGKRVLHAQLEANPRNAAQKPVVWSHARKLGARQEHFAAFEDSGSAVVMIGASLIISFAFFSIPLFAMISATIACGAVSLYILTRPSTRKNRSLWLSVIQCTADNGGRHVGTRKLGRRYRLPVLDRHDCRAHHLRGC